MKELKNCVQLLNIDKTKSIVYLFVFLCTVCLFISFTSEKNTAQAFSPQVIQHGAVGEDVIELQARLKHIGFYNSKVDGVFGWTTYWALRNFQYEFGMEIDGTAGEKTKNKLVKATKYNAAETKKEMYQTPGKKRSPQKKAPQQNKKPESGETTTVNVPQGFSQNDIDLIANAVHGESRGESYEGQVAVAAVILNRTKSPTFPNTVSGVIFEPRAFTAVADGQIWLTPDETSKRAVLDAINGWDPTGEAIYYFNPDTATSAWIWGRPQIKKIGKHIFCK